MRDFSRDKMPLSITLQRWKSGHGCPEHLHDSIEVVYVITGSGINTIDGASYPILAGDIYVVNRGSSHSLRVTADLRFYNLMFLPSAFSRKEIQLFNAMERFGLFFSLTQSNGPGIRRYGKLSPPPPFSDRFRALFDCLYRETTSAAPGHRMNCKAYLILILTEICRTQAILGGGETGAVDDHGTTPLSRVLAFINKNFLRDLSVDEVAAAGRLSRTYISEFFHERTGMHLVKYINVLRMEKARQLLLAEPELRVSELAARCGFDDPCYFTKIFRATLGCPPSQYRRTL
ncbi:MAG: AraC family transcriptional regulator [Lentisphaeria bacterium]